MSTAKAGRTAALSAQTSVLCLWLDRTSRSQPYGKTSHRDVFWFRPAHPPCGARTFPPCRRHTVTRMRKEDGFPKGRECALKYAAGVRTRGERRYAIFERTVNDMPVAYRLAMEENRRLSILWFSVPFLKELFVLLLRIVSSPPGCSGNETARVRRQPLWEKRFRRFS